MICEIQEEPKGQLYKELIKYAIKKSDVMMFAIRRDRYIYLANYKIIKKLSNILNVEIKDIETNYINYIEDRYDKLYRDYKFILGKEADSVAIWAKVENTTIKEEFKKQLILRIESEIEGRKQFLIQEKNTSELKERLKKYLVKEKHDSKWTVNEVFGKNEKENNQYIFDICFYKICPEVEKFLLESVDSLYAFDPPYLPEDIAFYKDGYCWFYTVTHEERCDMDIESIEECKYIENMGIKLEKYETNEKDKDLFEEYEI